MKAPIRKDVGKTVYLKIVQAEYLTPCIGYREERDRGLYGFHPADCPDCRREMGGFEVWSAGVLEARGEPLWANQEAGLAGYHQATALGAEELRRILRRMLRETWKRKGSGKTLGWAVLPEVGKSTYLG